MKGYNLLLTWKRNKELLVKILFHWNEFSYLRWHYFCHDGPGESAVTNHEENDETDEKQEGDKVPVSEVQELILFDEVINTEQK